MSKQNEDKLRVSNWLEPTAENKAWLENEIRISQIPGHSPRRIIPETLRGIKTGRIALERSA